MPTAAQIDQACRDGYFCYVGNRQRVCDATLSWHGAAVSPGEVWVKVWKTGIWEIVPIGKVTITTEKVKGAGMGKRSKVTDIGVGKKSGKRFGGTGHTSSPTESQARAEAAKKKGDGADETKSPTEETPAAAEEEQPNKEEQPKGKKWKPKSTVSLAKQGDLPGVKTSERRDEAIEQLAEKFEEAKLAKAAADKDFKEHDELLVALMRRKKREFYSRSTWGEVSVPNPVVHAKFKRPKKDKPSKKK